MPTLSVLCALLIGAAGRPAAPRITVIPAPASVRIGRGGFVLDSTVSVRAAGPAAEAAAEWLRHVLAPSGTGRGRPIVLAVDGKGPAESYRLVVEPRAIRITGADRDGLFWGVQTLRQLLPPDFEVPGRAATAAVEIPSVTIADRPAFRWRGFMLDVSRHFLPVAEVKRQIDLAARYKLNVFHWHLTDDQGWRIEIRKYPRLTEVGAWRTEEDGTRSGGFYTQDEVREVVAFARTRHVMVVPEIEMPGHASAAIASYPWLGCPNRAIDVSTTWGVHADIFCVGRDRVLGFLDDVLDEVVPLFPAPWFHIGGDEVPKDQWRDSEESRARRDREGLRSWEALQSWFTRRMAGALKARGRTLVGWDEIMEGGIPPGVVVQAWRGDAQARKAARAGRDVIASPGTVYFDRTPDNLTLDRVYDFSPVPRGLHGPAARRIAGAEVALWSERINQANLDPMAYPRLLAYAEAVWSTGPKNRASFLARLNDDHESRLAAARVTVGPRDRAIVALRTGYDSAARRIVITADSGMPGITMRTMPSPLPDSGIVTVAAFLNGRMLPQSRRFEMTPHLARGRPVRLVTPPSPDYPGTGPFNLTDGALASSDIKGGFWQGWWGPDLDATIDLGSVRRLTSVEGSFLQDARSWILFPKRVTVWTSTDGAAWTEAGSASPDLPPTDPAVSRRRLGLPVPVQARWVRLRAENGGPLPPGHASAGQPAWIFADEILVR